MQLQLQCLQTQSTPVQPDLRSTTNGLWSSSSGCFSRPRMSPRDPLRSVSRHRQRSVEIPPARKKPSLRMLPDCRHSTGQGGTRIGSALASTPSLGRCPEKCSYQVVICRPIFQHAGNGMLRQSLTSDRVAWAAIACTHIRFLVWFQGSRRRTRRHSAQSESLSPVNALKVKNVTRVSRDGPQKITLVARDDVCKCGLGLRID